MINSKNLCLTKSFFIILPFLELLQLKMSSKTFNHNNFLRIIPYPRVGFWFESALFKLFKLLLAALLRYAQMFFFQLHSETAIFFGLFTLGPQSGRYLLKLFFMFGICFRLECAFFFSFLNEFVFLILKFLLGLWI